MLLACASSRMSHENFFEIAVSVSPPRTLYLPGLAGLGVSAEATGVGRGAGSSTTDAVRITAEAASLITSWCARSARGPCAQWRPYRPTIFVVALSVDPAGSQLSAS